MAAPKLNPTSTRGNLYSFSSQRKRGEHIAGFGVRRRRLPWLRPVPRKLKRSTGQPQTPFRRVEGLHGVVDHLVVHGAAAEGVGMADQGREWRRREDLR